MGCKVAGFPVIDSRGDAGLNFRAAGYRGFDPRLVAGCVLYVSASLGVTLNGGNAAAAANQGSAGGSVAQGTAAAQPAWSATGGPNGRPCFTFDGGDHLASDLAASAWASLHGPASTVFYVFRQTATANAYYGILGTSSSASSSRGIAFYWDNRAGISITANLRTAISNGTNYVIDASVHQVNNGFPANAWAISEHTFEYGIGGDDCATIRNGTSVKTSDSLLTTSASAPASTLIIGAMPTLLSNGLVGGMPEIIAFNRAPTAAERLWLRRGLGNYYGLTVS